MRKALPAIVLAGTLALTMGLYGCGGSDSGSEAGENGYSTELQVCLDAYDDAKRSGEYVHPEENVVGSMGNPDSSFGKVYGMATTTDQLKEALTVTLEGVDYTLPFTTKELLDNGWKLADHDQDVAEATYAPGESASTVNLYHEGEEETQDKSIYIAFLNYNNNDPWEKTTVISLTAYKGVDMKVAGIASGPNSTTEDVEAAIKFFGYDATWSSAETGLVDGIKLQNTFYLEDVEDAPRAAAIYYTIDPETISLKHFSVYLNEEATNPIIADWLASLKK